MRSCGSFSQRIFDYVRGQSKRLVAIAKYTGGASGFGVATGWILADTACYLPSGNQMQPVKQDRAELWKLLALEGLEQNPGMDCFAG